MTPYSGPYSYPNISAEREGEGGRGREREGGREGGMEREREGGRV